MLRRQMDWKLRYTTLPAAVGKASSLLACHQMVAKFSSPVHGQQVGQLCEHRNLIALGVPFVLKDRDIFIAVVLAPVHLKCIKVQYNRKS